LMTIRLGFGRRRMSRLTGHSFVLPRTPTYSKQSNFSLWSCYDNGAVEAQPSVNILIEK
jgi:hypothetical protein